MKLLAVMAHPDDAEIWVGGTIAKHVERGDEAHILYTAASEDSPRGREAKRGAAILGATVSFLGLVDGQVRDAPEACEEVREILQGIAPDVLITHWNDDVHPDHVNTALIVQRVLPFVMTHIRKVPRLWSCDTYFSIGTRGPFIPDIYVDVTAQWPRKLAAIQAHQSQRPESWIQRAERQCGLHGHRYIVPEAPLRPFYAEAFKRVIPFGYITPVEYLDF